MLELRRQIFHALLGLVLVILLNFDLINIKILIFILIIGLIISFFSKKYKIPIIRWFLEKFEREINIKGQGVLTYFIGIIAALFLFEKNIALASIIVLAFGDSFCHFGKFGSWRHPYNNLKFIEGILIGISIATLGSVFFVSFWKAFIGSGVAMIVESLDIKIKNVRIDDNLLVPITAGITMSLL